MPFMSRVYAKIRPVIASFFILSLLVMLAGCTGSSGFGRAPWDMRGENGIVTKDPDSIPDIAWQTPGQRQDLTRQDQQYQRTQERAPEASATPTTKVPPAALPGSAAKQKISVSLLLPLSGKHAAMGQAMLNAAQMALFDVGSSGFELLPRDTRSTPAGAAAAARAAVSSGADLILGPIFADDVKAIKPIIAGTDIPAISYTTDWTLAGNNIYVTGFLPFAQVARVTRFAQNQGYRRFAVYAPQTEYSDIVIATLQKTGVPITKISRYSPLQPDISALVADFSATTDFDALVLPIGGEGLNTLVSVFGLSNIKSDNKKFIGTGLWDDPALAGNPALHGSWFAAPDPALRRDFEKRYQDNFGTAPPRLSTLAYDTTALAAVLARAPYEGPSPFGRAQLVNPRGFAGIDGVFRFRPDGLIERGLAVLEIRSGKAVVIDPAPTAFITAGP